MGSPRIQPFIPRWTTGRRSVVTMLILISVLGFIGEVSAQIAAPGFVAKYLSLSMQGIRQGYLWEVLTYLFIHGDPGGSIWLGIVHLSVNMMTLYFVGREVEAIVGPRHLLVIYFLGGVLGGLGQIFWTGGLLTGSSAGVCAVLLAFTTILPEYELTMLVLFVIPVRLRAKFVGWGAAGISAGMAVFHLLPGIGHVAHFGGCVAGWIYARQLGFGNPWWIQRRMNERRQRERRLDRMSPDQYMTEEIDPILDKIAREGMRSLTRNERRLLERGRDKISQKETRISVR